MLNINSETTSVSLAMSTNPAAAAVTAKGKLYVYTCFTLCSVPLFFISQKYVSNFSKTRICVAYYPIFCHGLTINIENLFSRVKRVFRELMVSLYTRSVSSCFIEM